MPVLKNKQKRQEVRQALYDKLDSSGELLPEVVKSLRKMLSKDQEEFAACIGISLSTLRKIEQNRGNVTMESVHKILNRFALQLVVNTKRKADTED